MWLKYKHKWAHGIDREWSWTNLGGSTAEVSKEWLNEVLGALRNENDWSDKYRGLEHVLMETAPREVVEAEIEKYRAKMALCVKAIEELQKELTQE